MRRSCLGYELLSRPDPVLLDEGVGGRIRSFRITAVRATLDGFPPGHVGCVLPFERQDLGPAIEGLLGSEQFLDFGVDALQLVFDLL